MSIGGTPASFDWLTAGLSIPEADVPQSCCESGKPVALTMQYTGDDCTATSHTQDPRKVKCEGDPNDADPVFIIANDKKDPDDPKAKVWFSGDVPLDGLFDIDAAFAGQSTLKKDTYIHIFVDDSKNVKLQTVKFHTSCSQPLNTGDQFGASRLVNCEGPGGGPGDGTCDAGKPKILEMKYTGKDCSASSNAQDPGKLSCDGDPAFASLVHIVATDKENPDDKKAKLWFEGNVVLDTTFDIDAANDGASKLKANTWVLIYSGPGRSGLLQAVKFHTSCSQPLNLGDVFGSLELVGFTPE